MDAAELHESSPIFGNRGCRACVTYREISEIQTPATLEAAIDVAAKSGQAPILKTMITMVATRRELELMEAVVDRVAAEVLAEPGRTAEYLAGTIIGQPCATLMVGKFAEVSEFLSFGTIDLVQTMVGISRDDVRRLRAAYVEQGMIAKNSFVSLDVDGVSVRVPLAAKRRWATRTSTMLEIYDEDGGDPASIDFSEARRLEYVGTSSY